MRPGRVNLVDGNCSRTFSLFGDYILRRTRSPVAEPLLSLSLFFLFLSPSRSLVSIPYAYPSSEGPLSSRTPRLMSAPLGTFNSEERVQISTAIRLARQLPPGRESPAHSISLSLSPVLSFQLPSPPSLFFFPFHLPIASLRNEYASGICAEEISSRVSSRG